MPCRSKIVFIGYEIPLGLQSVEPYLKRLSKYVPSENLSFEYVPVDTTPEELEEIVKTHVEEGCGYFGLPINSELVNTFIKGEDLGGPVDKRWADIQFMAEYAIFLDRYYPNVHVFADVRTPLDESLIQYNLVNFVKDAGHVYIIYQGDALTEQMVEYAKVALDDLGINANFFKVGSESGIDMDALEEVENEISLMLPPPPAVSSVIHIINRLNADEYTRAATEAGIFNFRPDLVVHSSFLDEYKPVDVSLPVPLYIGMSPLKGIPSSEAKAIGLPLQPEEYYSLPLIVSYFDAYMWAATCGKTDGINDKQLRFDGDNIRISYYLAELSVPKNQLGTATGPFLFNARWFDPSAEVVPEEIV